MTTLEAVIESARSLPFLLGWLAIALLLVVFEVGRRVARAARVAGGVPGDASSRWGALREQAGATVVDWRAGLKSPALRRSFAHVAKLLRRILPGTKSIYRTPWLLTVGPTGSGKTTLLGQTGLVLPLGEPGEIPEIAPSGCNWWIYDRAVAADLAGDMVLQAEGTESSELSWRGFLQLLGQHRTARPADGVVLTLSVDEILDVATDDNKAQQRLAERASVLRRKLLEAQERLGLRLPVFVLLTQCDRVRGWQSFVDLLDPELRREAVGWSAPGAFDKPYSPSWVGRAFASVRRGLCLAQLRALNGRLKGAGDRELSAFPAALGELEQPLGIVLNQIFAGGSADESPVLRGLYFCGGSGFPNPAAEPMTDESPVAVPGTRDEHRRVDFLQDLFSEKILYEWNLARPTAKAMRRGQRRVVVLRSLVAGLLLAFPLLIWFVVQEIPDRVEILSAELFEPIDTGLGRGSSNSDELAKRLRESRPKIGAYRLGSPILPWAWLPDRELRDNVSLLYSKNSFPAARRALENGLHKLANDRLPQVEVQVPVLGVDTVPEFVELRQMTADLGRVENGLQIYDCYAPRGMLCGSPRGFYRLEEDLYGNRFDPPNPAARSFYRGVLRGVVVAEFSGEEYTSKLRDKTLELSRLMFESLYEDNALIDALDQLNDKIELVTRLAEPGELGLNSGTVSGLDRAGSSTVALASTASRARYVEPEALALHARELLQRIDTVDKFLEDPRLGWVQGKRLELGTEYDSWWRSLGKSRFLGQEVKKGILSLGNRGFTTFQTNLVAPRSDIGALVERSIDTDRYELSTVVQQLRRSLRSFLSQPFIGQTGGNWLQVAGLGEYLDWRPNGLARAVAAFTDYDSSIQALDDDKQGAEVMQSEAAQTDLSNYVLQILNDAQVIAREPELASAGQLEDHLEKVAGAFLAQADDLELLLTRLHGTIPGSVTCRYCDQQPGNGWCQLQKVVEGQREYIFNIMYRLLGSYYPYRVDAALLASWDGSAGPARTLFQFADADAATSSFEAWLGKIQMLDESYSSKLLVASNSANCFVDGAEQQRFQLIQADLQQLAAEKPNNAIASLRDLVTEALMTVDSSSCLEALEPRPGCFSLATPSGLRDLPCDYFLGRRNDLADAVEQRCAVLGVELARTSYGRIQQAFAGGLEGKYPFTADYETGQSQASRSDVVGFLKIYDDNRAAVERFLRRAITAPQRGIDLDQLNGCLDGATQSAGSRRPGSSCGIQPAAEPSPTGVELGQLCGCLRGAIKPQQGSEDLLQLCDFMTSLEATRRFFDPYLMALVEDPESALAFALEVDYRVQRQREIGANQIIRWAVEVEGRRVPDGSQETPATWAQGQPVKLVLDWAADGLREPLDKPGGPAVAGTAVTYDYQDNWALLTLLARHQSPTSGICPDTLELIIPTVAAGASEPTEPSNSSSGRWLPWRRQPHQPATAAPSAAKTHVVDARVFVRVRIQDSAGQLVEVPLPAALMAPGFPAEVTLGTW